MGLPYPGYPPNYTQLHIVGGYVRSCFVIELLTLGELSDVELALVKEHMEAAVESLQKRLVNIERTDVVDQSRFDRQLRSGLRL